MIVKHDNDVWRDLVDVERLAAWMQANAIGEGDIADVAPIGGGTQNVMLRFSRGRDGYVLRRPPRVPRRESASVMRREARILSALQGSDVPHAGFIQFCDDPDVLGTPFYLMEPVDGFNAVEGLPVPHSESPALRRRMGEALVDGIVALSRVDIEAVDLKDIGKLDNWIGRQVSRWLGQLESYVEYPQWPGPSGLPDFKATMEWLKVNQPESMTPGLVHGDYHFGNVMYRRTSAELAAIVDWEMTTVGDPLLDLGQLIAMWPEPDVVPQDQPPVKPWDGFIDISTVVERYVTATGRSHADVKWFEILACFKLGSILEGSYARACAGLAPMEIGLRLHGKAVRLFHRALRRID